MTLTMEMTGGDPADSPLARFSWLRAVTTWADEAGPVVRGALKDKAPVGKDARAGRLRDSIRYERETSEASVTMTFAAYVPYASYVLHGTGPHLITAQAARALQFADSGGTVMYRKSVHHPGTKANKFNEKAVTPLIPWLQSTLRDAVQASMEGL